MIQSQQLRYQYPGAPPLVFPDMDVPQGSVVLVSGTSGCGKSTLLALIAALVPPAAGELVVAGQALHTLTAVAADAWRATKVGFLPQRLHLSAALNVQDNLRMAQWAAGQPQDDRAIAAALAALGVDAFAQRKPAQLSGGQAQRVALARAVLLQPCVILADEPTASLDDDAAADAIALLTSTASEQGTTLLIATHDARVGTLIPALTDGSAGFTPIALARMAVAA